jgi:hypothetical protein
MSSITMTVREPQVAQPRELLSEPEVALNSACGGSWRVPLSPGYRPEDTRASAVDVFADGAIVELSPLGGA